MQKYTFDGYAMTLEDTGRTGDYGKVRVRYTFSIPEGEELFAGDDLFASPMHDPEGLENAKALLTFLTLQPGDTDEEYFEKYSPRQMEFARSHECEMLSLFCYDD